VSSTIAMVFSMALLDDLLLPPGSAHPSRSRLLEGMSRYAAAGVQQVPFGPGPARPEEPADVTKLSVEVDRDSAPLAPATPPRSAPPVGRRDRRLSATTERIVAAARRCFERDGVGATRMAAVAAEADLARPTLYKFVGSRRELLEFALIERCRELLGDINRRIAPPSNDVREDLNEFVAIMVEITRGDHEFSSLAEALPRENAFGLMSGPSELRTLVENALTPYFDRADAQGVLRSIPRDQLAGLAQTVMTPLAARTDLDRQDLRTTLRQLLGPALFNS
jgi:AcrR family transcriptional regulator